MRRCDCHDLVAVPRAAFADVLESVSAPAEDALRRSEETGSVSEAAPYVPE